MKARADRGPVLVVDDDDDIREIIELALGTQGYRVVTADSGAECLRQLRGSLRPCVILLDMMMPGMTGLQVYEQLAMDPALASIPVIILTGNVQVRGDQLATVPMLRKPIQLAALVEAIERYATAAT